MNTISNCHLMFPPFSRWSRFLALSVPCWENLEFFFPWPSCKTHLFVIDYCTHVKDLRCDNWFWTEVASADSLIWHEPPNLLFWCQASSSYSKATMIVMGNASESRCGSSAPGLPCLCQLYGPHFWKPEEHLAAAQSSVICLTIGSKSGLIKDQSCNGVKPMWVCSEWAIKQLKWCVWSIVLSSTLFLFFSGRRVESGDFFQKRTNYFIGRMDIQVRTKKNRFPSSSSLYFPKAGQSRVTPLQGQSHPLVKH